MNEEKDAEIQRKKQAAGEGRPTPLPFLGIFGSMTLAPAFPRGCRLGCCCFVCLGTAAPTICVKEPYVCEQDTRFIAPLCSSSLPPYMGCDAGRATKENVLANFSFSFMICLGLHSSGAAQRSLVLHNPGFCTKSGRGGAPGAPMKGRGSWGVPVRLLLGGFPGQMPAWGGFPQVAAIRMAHFPKPKGKKCCFVP